MVPTVVQEDGDVQHFFPRVSSVVWSMPESIRSFVEECYLSALNFSKVSVVVFCGFNPFPFAFLFFAYPSSCTDHFCGFAFVGSVLASL